MVIGKLGGEKIGKKDGDVIHYMRELIFTGTIPLFFFLILPTLSFDW